jgi:hypothetical protein
MNYINKTVGEILSNISSDNYISNINIKENDKMNFVSEKEYLDAVSKVKDYETRQDKILRFKRELGKRLEEFDKFTFKTKNNKIIFAGYIAPNYIYTDRLLVGEAICDEKDQFDKLLGKLIAVRKSLGLKIDDIVDIVEPIKSSGVAYCDGYSFYIKA